MKQVKFFTAQRMALIAVFSALSGVLYLFGFSIPVAFAPWLELNFSDIPALVGTFSLGPVSGSIIVFIKIFIKLIIKGTSSVFVGELADLIIGLALVIPAGIIYKHKRTLKGAVISLFASSFSSVLAAVIANRFILIPFYVNVMHWDLSMLTGMIQGIYKNVTEQTFYVYYLGLSVVPFNVLRCLIASLVTALVYKKISSSIKRMSSKFGGTESDGSSLNGREKYGKKAVITVAVSVGVLVLLIAGVLLRYFLK